MTSTSFMTGTGFMKCMPMTFSGLVVQLASFVMEIDEVFEAMMAYGLSRLSNSFRTPRLTSMFSTMASTTKSTSFCLKALISSEKEILFLNSSISVSLILFFVLSLPSQSLTNFYDFLREVGLES